MFVLIFKSDFQLNLEYNIFQISSVNSFRFEPFLDSL